MGIGEDTIANIIASIREETNDDDKFGVHLDEMATLAQREDPFDVGVDNGPDPPIEEELNAVVPYCVIEHEDGDIVVNRMAYNLIAPGNTVVIYGPRRSGKSRFIRAIAQRVRTWFPEVLVFTMTKSSCEYHGYVPDTCIIEGLDEDLLLEIIMAQFKKKRAESRGEPQGNYEIFVIIDDCMAEKLRYKDIFNRVFYNGRHANITLIVTCQDVKGIAPAASLNADLAFTFCLPDRRGRDTIREKFADYLTRDQFDALMDSDAINKKYHLLGFDIKHRYNPLDSRIFFGCVDGSKDEKFVMGDRPLWEHDLDQLKELGFRHLIDEQHWDIEQPKE